MLSFFVFIIQEYTGIAPNSAHGGLAAERLAATACGYDNIKIM